MGDKRPGFREKYRNQGEKGQKIKQSRSCGRDCSSDSYEGEIISSSSVHNQYTTIQFLNPDKQRNKFFENSMNNWGRRRERSDCLCFLGSLCRFGCFFRCLVMCCLVLRCLDRRPAPCKGRGNGPLDLAVGRSGLGRGYIGGIGQRRYFDFCICHACTLHFLRVVFLFSSLLLYHRRGRHLHTGNFTEFSGFSEYYW